MFASPSSSPQFPHVPISLTSVSLVKIAAVILDRPDVKNKAWDKCSVLAFCLMDEKRKEWLPVEKDVICKANSLPLPTSLKTELAKFTAAMSWELFLWLDFHVNKHQITTNFPDCIIWKPSGIIDRKKTALLMVKDTRLGIVERYKLACLYCLESDISALWKQLNIGKDFKKTLRDNKLDEHLLVSFWCHHVACKLRLLLPMIIYWCDSFRPNEYAFRISVDSDNEIAVRYFYEKLTAEEKVSVPLDTIRELKRKPYAFQDFMGDPSEQYFAKKRTGVLLFFFEVMNETLQNDLLHLDPGLILERFLDWPFQSWFMKVVAQWSSCLKRYTYKYLLESIATRANKACPDSDYEQLYREFWENIPSCYKKYVLEKSMDEGFLLLYLGNQENLVLLFESMPKEDRELFIFSEYGEEFCKRLIFDNMFHSLKYFIIACIASRQKALKLRKKMTEWQLNETSSEDDDSSDEDDDDDDFSKDWNNENQEKYHLDPGEAYHLLGLAIESMDDLLREKYKRIKNTKKRKVE